MDFDELMKIVEKHSLLSKKVIISAQPESLILKNEKYWHKKLKKAGFRLICKAKNPTIWFYMAIPSSNYNVEVVLRIYMRKDTSVHV
jgi:hypothetical protein